MSHHHHTFFRRRNCRGVAAIEFALLIGPMVLLLFGATEYGRAIYTYNTLDKAVRDAVRHLSQHGPGDALIRGQALCLATTGSYTPETTTCTGAPLAPGLTTSNVQLCDASPGSCPSTHAAQETGEGSINLVSVTITGYAFDSMVEYVMPDLNFNAISATMRAQL